MNRPTTAEPVLAMPDTERDAYAAEVCMGWVKVFHLGEYCYSHNGIIQTNGLDYEPSQPTEKGKSQCWGLIIKFGLRLQWHEDTNSGWVEWFDADEEGHLISTRNLQAAVVTAAILCALTEKEK